MGVLDLLLIEDNPLDVYLIDTTLKAHHLNYRLRVIRDGAEARQFFENPPIDYRPDIIFLDIHLPHVSGHDLLLQIKINSKYGTVPVVAVSSSPAQADRDRMMAAGAAFYLRKKADLDSYATFAAVIEHVLQQQSRL